jgi:hypothetical protein
VIPAWKPGNRASSRGSTDNLSCRSSFLKCCRSVS